MIDFDLKDPYLRLFYEETLSNLEILEKGLLTVENQKEVITPEHIEPLFRLAHSVKGSFATTGLNDLVDLSHELENHLSAIQSGEFEPDPSWFSLALTSVDALISLLKASVFGWEHKIEVEPLIIQFKNIDLKTKPIKKIEIKVKFEQSTIFLGVKSLMIVKAIDSMVNIDRTVPSDFETEDEDFLGELILTVTTRASYGQLKRAIEKISEIKEIEFEEIHFSEPLEAKIKPLGEEIIPHDSVKVSLEQIDQMQNILELMRMNRRQFNSAISILKKEEYKGAANWILENGIEHQEQLMEQLRNHFSTLSLVPLKTLFDRLPRMVRDLSKSFNVDVELEISGECVCLERHTLSLIFDPLTHLIRNAFAHGFNNQKTGKINIDAFLHSSFVILSIKDNGNGIDIEKIKKKALELSYISLSECQTMSSKAWYDYIFKPGFSTMTHVNKTSGRGVGLDVVRENIIKLKGSIEVLSAPKKGTEFRIKLPVSQSSVRSILVVIDQFQYAIPLYYVLEVLKRSTENKDQIFWNQKEIPIVNLCEIGQTLLILSLADQQFALAVDEILREEDVLIQSVSHLKAYVKSFESISGVSFLYDGSVAYTLDSVYLINQLIKRGK